MQETVSQLAEVTKLRCAYSVDEAVDCMQAVKPGVVILDMMMAAEELPGLLTAIISSNSPAVLIALTSTMHHTIPATYSGKIYALDKYHEFEKIPGIITSLSNQNRTAQ